MNNDVMVFATTIAVIVILLVAISFIMLSTFYFDAQKKLIENKLEDKEILEEIEISINKVKKRCKTNLEIRNYFYKKQRNKKEKGNIFSYSFSVLFFLIVVLFGFVTATSMNTKTMIDNNQFWIGDTALLVIQTDSMASAYRGNTYLKDENGSIDDEDRIPQYCLISISKNEDYINSIQLNDIVAFQMISDDNETYITVVHRLIKITYDDNNEPLYTFRGDSNNSSMVNETDVKKDMIIGVFETDNYKGFKNLFLGYFISYIESNLGITMSIIAILLFIIYGVLYDKLKIVYDNRYRELFELKLKEGDINA